MRRFARRKWGWWLVLIAKPRFKIKVLFFKRRKSISLQRHKRRNELWLILSGNGFAQSGQHITPTGWANYKTGDYFMVRKMNWHQYMAVKKTLVLEIQFGELCNENDIERKE